MSNVFEALDRLELLDDPSGTSVSELVVAANPVLVNGEVVAERDGPDLLDEVGVGLLILPLGIRHALRERYGETLSARDLELIVSGVTLTVMALRRYAILDGIPPQPPDDDDIETPSP